MKNAPTIEQSRGRGRTAAGAAKSTASPTPSPLTPRLYRLGRALLRGPRTVRELMPIVPSNNPAEYVSQLRTDYGLTVICEHVPFMTVDGTKSWFGRYRLTTDDRAKLRALVGGRR